MHIPIIASLKNAASNAIESASASAVEAPEPTEEERRPSRLGRHRRPFAFREHHHDAQESKSPHEGEEGEDLEERSRACPRGKAFYRCANGFRGCCSHDPCDRGGSCRDGQKESRQKENPPTATHAQRPTSHVTEHHHSVTRHHPHHHSHHMATTSPHSEPHSQKHSEQQTSHMSSISSTTSILSATQTASSSSTPTSSTTMSGRSPPACPSGNGTHYTDSAKMEYIIHCGVENTFVSYNAVYVSLGGYGECFSACSNTDQCAGFTFVGSVNGNCYMKSQMPSNAYVTHDGNNYVTCAKANPPHNTGTGSSTTTPKKAGIIAGAVIGSILLLCLLLFLIAFCAKRHRKKVEAKRATITHVIQGPIEMQPYRPPEHQRQGSTSHDVYLPNGGTASGNAETTAKSNSQAISTSSSAPSGLEQTFRGETNEGVRPESGFVPIILPGFHQPPQSPSNQPQSPGPQSQPHGQRGASTIHSPTLGLHPGYSRSFANDVRRNQYLANTAPARNTPSPKALLQSAPI